MSTTPKNLAMQVRLARDFYENPRYWLRKEEEESVYRPNLLPEAAQYAMEITEMDPMVFPDRFEHIVLAASMLITDLKEKDQLKIERAMTFNRELN